MNKPMIFGNFTAAFRLKLFRISILTALFAFASATYAQYGPDDEAEALEAMKPKVEAEAKLPPSPKPQDLLVVDTGPTSRQTFAIDSKSLTVSPDHIIRYTLVATSPSGSQNISYEGIDCKTREFKRYAYGSKDGKWTRSRHDKWERVSSMSQNQLHFTLHSQYFCQAGLSVGGSQELVDRLRYNRPITY